MSDLKIAELDTRMTALEKQFSEFKDHISDKLDSIETFVGGYNNILGLAKKHWKTVAVFGAGVMSAAGVGNPAVLTFIQHFLGG